MQIIERDQVFSRSSVTKKVPRVILNPNHVFDTVYVTDMPDRMGSYVKLFVDDAK